VDWVNIGFHGLLGGSIVIIASLVAELIARLTKRKGAIRGIVFISVAIVLLLFSKSIVKPAFLEWRYQQEVEKAMQEFPIYQKIAQHEPDTYVLFKKELIEMLKKGENPSVMRERGAIILLPILLEYLPYSSDEAIIGFTESLIEVLQALEKEDPLLCYQYAYDEQSLKPTIFNYVPSETINEVLTNMANVIGTGAENPQKLPNENEVINEVLLVVANLYEIYGDDVQLLENPQDPEVDKNKLCLLTIASYKEVLQLPKSKSAQVLRYLYSSE